VSWWKVDKVPDENENFNKIVYGLVIKCPSSMNIQGKKDSKNSEITNKPKYKYVSNLNCSFRYRNINDKLLTTLLCLLKKSILKGTYKSISASDSVEDNVNQIISNSHYSDKNYDLIVFKERQDMSKVEAIYYYIRNSFAHGSFEVKYVNGKYVYWLESGKNGDIKAQMRLSEDTLMKYINYASKSADEIRQIQKPQKSKKA
jgi:hypothetical protein